MKIDIFSGFLGAGKTTLIKKLIREAYGGEKIVLIENEFGEIGVDGGFLRESGVEITEMNSGCICCSLVGDFAKALREVAGRFSPDRIVIEPSGVGKLSDVIRAVQRAAVPNAELNAFCTVVDAKKCKMYLRNFGEFFLDQVEHASCIVLSHTALPAERIAETATLLKEHNGNATIVTTDWEKLSGKELLAAMERKDTLREELMRLTHETEQLHHHGEEEGHCHHHGEEEAHCHHHGEEEGHCHHHGEEEGHCHHHHHADEVFTAWGKETAKQYDAADLRAALEALDSGEYGQVLRAKGIVDGKEGWIYFDYVPGETDLRTGAPYVTGRLCVIGCGLDETKLSELFGVK